MDSKALTDAEIDRILELEAKATPGPWREGGSGNPRVYGPDKCGPEVSGLVASFARYQDRPFIAAARNSIRSLAEEVQRSRARIEAAPHESGCGRLYNSDTSMKFTQLPCDCWKSESNPAPRVADTKGEL